MLLVEESVAPGTSDGGEDSTGALLLVLIRLTQQYSF